MKRGNSSLTSAISDLRREIEAGLKDNVYYLTTQKLNELSEIVNSRNGGEPPTANGKPQHLIGFGPALETLRAKLDAELKDNRYYLASHKLDVIALIAARAKTAKPQAALAPTPESAASVHAAIDTSRAAPAAAPQPGTEPKSFDDLAAESRKRVEQATSEASDAPQADETFYERRSSEPCAAAELEAAASPALAEPPRPAATAASPSPEEEEPAQAPEASSKSMAEPKKGLFSYFVRAIRGE